MSLTEAEAVAGTREWALDPAVVLVRADRAGDGTWTAEVLVDGRRAYHITGWVAPASADAPEGVAMTALTSLRSMFDPDGRKPRHQYRNVQWARRRDQAAYALYLHILDGTWVDANGDVWPGPTPADGAYPPGGRTVVRGVPRRRLHAYKVEVSGSAVTHSSWLVEAEDQESAARDGIKAHYEKLGEPIPRHEDQDPDTAWLGHGVGRNHGDGSRSFDFGYADAYVQAGLPITVHLLTSVRTDAASSAPAGWEERRRRAIPTSALLASYGDEENGGSHGFLGAEARTELVRVAPRHACRVDAVTADGGRIDGAFVLAR